MHLKGDDVAKLKFHGLDLIFRSIRVQIRIFCGQLCQTQPFAYFKTRSFSTVRTRMCTGVHALTTKKLLLLHGWLKARVFFSHTYLLRSRLTSNHGVPMGNPHNGVLVTKSAFTYARKNIHSGGPRNKKCTSSTSRCLSVWAKNILGSSLMIAHDGHTGQTAYGHIRHIAEFH